MTTALRSARLIQEGESNFILIARECLILRSVVEPIRKYCRRKGKLGQVRFYEAECTSVDVKNQKIKCVGKDMTRMLCAWQRY